MEQEISLSSLNDLISFFTVVSPVTPDLLTFIKSYIEMRYNQQLLLSKTQIRQ